MKLMRKAFLLFFLFLFLLPEASLAICEGPIVPCGGPGDPCRLCDLFVLFNNIIDFIITCLTPIAASLMLVVGGVYLLMAGGSPAQTSQAKSIITAAVIGLVIVLTSWVFVNTFLTYVEVATWTGLGSWWEIECP